jgi:glycosyltransferase involved in cell wall biosynthesis
LARGADAVVAQSQNTRRTLAEYFAADVPASIIPLGIARPAAVSAERAAFGLSSTDVILVTVGRLIRRKRVDQLVGILARLPEHARLLVIGDGPEEAHLRAQADSLGIAGRITFAGRVSDEDKFRLLAAADIFVSTSQHEGFGLVFLEAMAMGLPIVCYGNGGQTDYLVDGRSGYVVELNDVAAFAERCAPLCDDESLRRRMADWNKRRVEDYFIDNCARQYEALFESIIAGRSSS